jgi:hypothetical protein
VKNYIIQVTMVIYLKIVRGYLFDKNYIFKDYVDNLYKIKLNHDKNHPII